MLGLRFRVWGFRMWVLGFRHLVAGCGAYAVCTV